MKLIGKLFSQFYKWCNRPVPRDESGKSLMDIRFWLSLAMIASGFNLGLWWMMSNTAKLFPVGFPTSLALISLGFIIAGPYPLHNFEE